MTEQMDLLQQGRAEVDAICALIVTDPVHARDKAAVVDAIRRTAEENNGIVDQNLVRPLLPSWVYPKVVGAVYRQLVSVKAIRAMVRPDGAPVLNQSDDTKGRNSGRWQPVYRWVGDLS